MKKYLVGTAVAVAAVLAPFTSAANAASPIPAACVIVSHESGLNVQVGYAPNGPSDCTRLP